MSTRAVYSFWDNNDIFHVYKHYDNYPEGAVKFIKKAIAFAWKLPRFESGEFAAAFISANKIGNGDISMTTHWNNHADIEYRYEITVKNNELYIFAIEMPENKVIFEGNLKEMVKKYGE